jgi:hypothetical protein
LGLYVCATSLFTPHLRQTTTACFHTCSLRLCLHLSKHRLISSSHLRPIFVRNCVQSNNKKDNYLSLYLAPKSLLVFGNFVSSLHPNFRKAHVVNHSLQLKINKVRLVATDRIKIGVYKPLSPRLIQYNKVTSSLSQPNRRS